MRTTDRATNYRGFPALGKAYPLDEFKAWLVARGRARSAVNVYASHVRRVLHVCEGKPTPEGLTAAVEQSAPTETGNMRTAWRWYARFRAEAGETLATFPDRCTTEAPLPPEAALIAELSNHIPLHMIPDLRWGNVRATGGDEAEIGHPSGFHRWRVPLDLARRLRAMVKPEDYTVPFGVPLVPALPASTRPMTIERLRDLSLRSGLKHKSASGTLPPTPLD